MFNARLERLARALAPTDDYGERQTSPSTVVVPVRAPPMLNTRAFALQLPPLALDVPMARPPPPPNGAPADAVAAEREATFLRGGVAIDAAVAGHC